MTHFTFQNPLHETVTYKDLFLDRIAPSLEISSLVILRSLLGLAYLVILGYRNRRLVGILEPATIQRKRKGTTE